MSDWNFNFLEEWDNLICKIGKDNGLDWFPINYEVCDYYEMIGHMSYHGMPSHYPHWSFGKSFERTHFRYNAGAEGLPYELIINSNPSIAYLMRENPAYLQILIMAHCIGHSDFFKNNRLFKDTHPEVVVSRMRNARRRMQEYVEDPSIGINKVENILDALHAIRNQVDWYPRTRVSHEELKDDYIKRVKYDTSNKYRDFNVDKIPLEPDYDILGFIAEHANHLSDWEQDIIYAVRDESLYFIPQIKTKIINEGWACFWHYRILNELELPQKYYIPFLKSHNQVVRPILGGINPYHVGFYLFNKIEERFGLEECFFARETSHDEAFLRTYLTEEDCQALNLFSYSHKKDNITIDDISDVDGWKKVKHDLIRNVGINSIPRMVVKEVDRNRTLTIRHEHDGRDLELGNAKEVVGHIETLWGDTIKLLTIVEDEPWEF